MTDINEWWYTKLALDDKIQVKLKIYIKNIQVRYLSIYHANSFCYWLVI